MTLSFGLNIKKLYVHHEFVFGQDRLFSLTWAYQIQHMGVSPWDNILCYILDLSMTLTFDLPVYVDGSAILSEFY